MKPAHALNPVDSAADQILSGDIQNGSADAFRLLMSRNNQRLFRVARSFMDSDHEAEDVVQQAYVNAYEKMGTFRGDASLSTWLTRIVINEAKQRIRNRKRMVDIQATNQSASASQVVPFPLVDSTDPAVYAARSELRHCLEAAIDKLPPTFRAVFVLRVLEECSVEETARSLELLPATVKTRLHRARHLMRTSLEASATSSLKDAFHFLGLRCARISQRVIALLQSRGAALK